MPHSGRQFFLLFLLVPLTGCGWLADRGRDFMDMGILTLDVGPGFGLHAQFTDVARLGWENKEPTRLGASGRLAGIWTERRETLSLGPFDSHSLSYLQMNVAGVDYWDRQSQLDTWPSAANAFVQQRFSGSGEGVHGQWRDRQFLDIGYSIHLGYFGVSHFLKPLEVVDFACGLFGFDPAGDDVNHHLKESEK